jgi:tungstate transport system ATP-binding protein
VLYELKDIVKIYDPRIVLDVQKLNIQKGHIIALLGPNGAGKTTLLEILAFLMPPSSGEIWFERQKVDFQGGRTIQLRRKVVLVQQKPILFSTTVSKNVEFPLKIRRIPGNRREEIAREFLDLVGMRAFRNAQAHKLSGGETQRIAIAQALACFPEVILLDEPTASVDIENQITIERIIREINLEKGISIIFTTHDMIQASRLADKILFLYEGKAVKSIYENIYSGRIELDNKGRKQCVLQNGLKFRIGTDRTGAVRISIDPDKIKISKRRSRELQDNSVRGRLIQITAEKEKIRTLVDIGIPLSILIPNNTFRGLDFKMGEDIWITCPPESIDVF